MRGALHVVVALAWLSGIATPVAAGTADADGRGFLAEDLPAPVPPPGTVSEFALLAPLVGDGLIAARGMTRTKKPPKEAPQEPRATDGDSAATQSSPTETRPAPERRRTSRARRMGGSAGVLTGERARLMLQSLTVPGWGQASIGQSRTALAFGLLEVGVWGSFTAFRLQERMRRHTYERTARLFGGIELAGRDEGYRRIVGLYLDSDEYNRLVVRRDAANLFFGDPAAYDAYIAEHEIRGADVWAWSSEADFLRYRAERQATQRASKHAQDALAAAVINRLLSVIHASRSHARPAPDQTSWRVECVPVGNDPTAFRLALRADF